MLTVFGSIQVVMNGCRKGGAHRFCIGHAPLRSNEGKQRGGVRKNEVGDSTAFEGTHAPVGDRSITRRQVRQGLEFELGGEFQGRAENEHG